MISGKTKIIVSILGLVCAGLIITGVYFFVKEDAFLNECSLISCRIIDINEDIRGTALLTFKDVAGGRKPFILTETYDPSEEDLDFKVGEICEIYYYSKDVNRSEIKGIFRNHTISFVLFMISLGFIFDIPILLFVSNRYNRMRKPDMYGIKKNEIVSE